MISRAGIDSVLIKATEFIENAILEREDGGKKFYAFPECIGKNRITEWGGTSSAISSLYRLNYSKSSDFSQKLKSAEEWLLSQQKDGAWDSSELFCSEATSAILYDLYGLNIIKKNQINKAIKYIHLCFNESEGYFKSTPNVHQSLHLYTTFLATRTLSKYDKLNSTEQEKIKVWIKSIQRSDGCWGETPKSSFSSVPHTVFALMTLSFCGIKKQTLVNSYSKTISWLKRQVYCCKYKYSLEQIERYSDYDTSGELPRILNIGHYFVTILSDFFMYIGDKSTTLITIDIILKSQVNGGWGIDTNKLSLWATQQAIECICNFKECYLDNYNMVELLIIPIPNVYSKIFISVISFLLLIWLLIDPIRRDSAIISSIFMILPWLWKKQY